MNQVIPITEYRKVDIKSVTCNSCRLPHTVNAHGLCAFCARPAVEGQDSRIKLSARLKASRHDRVMAVIGVTMMAAAFLVVALWLAGRW